MAFLHTSMIRVKLFLCLTKRHAMSMHGRVELCGQFHPRYPLDSRLGESHSWSGRGGEENNSLSLPGIEPRSS
jgi:hypothetical protein